MKSSAKIIAFPNKSLSSVNGEEPPLLDINASVAPENIEDPVAIEPVINPTALNLPSAAQAIIAENTEGVRPRKPFRLDELTKEQFEKYAENHYLVKLMDNEKLSPAAAIERAGAKRTVRAVAHLYKRYKDGDQDALIDLRWCRQPPAMVLIAAVKNIIFGLLFSRPAAGINLIARLTIDFCRKNNLPIPSVKTVQKFYRRLPESVKMARSPTLLREWRKQGAPVTRYENTSRANERWQVDHTTLDIWIRILVNGKWKAVRCYLTLALDAHTRAIAGFWLSTKSPDAWAIKLMLRNAIRPKQNKNWSVFGVPSYLQCDCGKDWLSEAVGITLMALGIIIDPDAPYYPNSKGKCERVFRTLDQGLLRGLKGHILDIGTSETSADMRIAELLTRDQLLKEITRWVVDVYHQAVHSETERKPNEFWEETVALPILPTDDELNTLLLHQDVTRTVQSHGIRWKKYGVKHLFWHPEFAHHWREKVSLAYNPEDTESVYIYGTDGKFVCEAWNMRAEKPRYSLEDVKQARKQFYAGLRGLKERYSSYLDEVDELDRRIEQAKGWETGREIAAAMVLEDAGREEEEAEGDEELNKILEEFHRQDIGEI